MEPFKKKYSGEVRDVLNEPSSWMMTWGMLSILSVLMLILIGSYFYKYPDLIIADVVITTENPPISMVSKINGKINKIMVNEGQKVNKKDLLILIESTGDYDDIQSLKSDLIQLNGCLIDGIKKCNINRNQSLLLGSIQDSYSSVLEDYDFYERVVNSIYYKEKNLGQDRQLKLHQLYFRKITSQNEILRQELVLSKNDLLRDSSLKALKVISEQEYRNTKKIYLQKLYSFHEAQTSLANLNIKIDDIKNGKIDIEENESIQFSTIKRSLQKKVSVVMSEISRWEEVYTIKCPIDGVVSFAKFNTSGLNVVAGETIISVIPVNSTKLSVRGETSIQNAGKLEAGLKVNIKIDNYPYLEYGIIKGTLERISLVPENKNYYVSVKLEKGLQTSLNKTLPLSQRMSGRAEIITKDRRLIQRIIEPLSSILKN